MKLIKSQKLNVYIIPIKKAKIFFEGQGYFEAHIANNTNAVIEFIFGHEVYAVKPRKSFSAEYLSLMENVALKLRFDADVKPREGHVYLDVYEI